MNIYEKLTEVQNLLKVGKSNYNEFGKYKYRSCGDILEAVKPLLKEYKLNLVLSDDLVLIGDRFYVKVTGVLVDIEKPEMMITVTSLAREEATKKGMDGSQITGASSSYARKYLLNGLFAIDDTLDSDATNKHGKGDDENVEDLKPDNKIDGEMFISEAQQRVLFNAAPAETVKIVLLKNKKTKTSEIQQKDFDKILLEIKKAVKDGGK